MSTFSLPRLINGSGLNNNRKNNYKYGSLSNKRISASFAESHNPNKFFPLTRCESDQLQLERRKSINRNGTIARNQFRGIKREHLERQTKIIIHSMTVCIFSISINYVNITINRVE